MGGYNPLGKEGRVGAIDMLLTSVFLGGHNNLSSGGCLTTACARAIAKGQKSVGIHLNVDVEGCHSHYPKIDSKIDSR